MPFTETALKQSIVYTGKLLKIRDDEVRLHNGETARREIVEHPGGVAVVAVTDDKKVVCVRQFRYAMKRELLEIPAGKLERGEEPLGAVKRELSEETGYTAKTWRSLGEIFPTPGYCEEILHLYLATDLIKGEAHPDENEFLSVCEFTFYELNEKIMANEISDAKTIVGILIAGRILYAL
ncbi:MAG: NUDIX hydrolase [Oscillospiraceae bacterium]|jgi:ADP-ribose pyrophosphatase|nr:NUDIX hydrolase [Oscillospiraceae bacterium]